VVWMVVLLIMSSLTSNKGGYRRICRWTSQRVSMVHPKLLWSVYLESVVVAGRLQTLGLVAAQSWS
jgi:hypothetical protein